METDEDNDNNNNNNNNSKIRLFKRRARCMFFSLDVSSSSYHPQDCHYLPLNEWLIHFSQVGRHMEHRHYTREEGEGACYIDNSQIVLLLHLLGYLNIRRFDLSKNERM